MFLVVHRPTIIAKARYNPTSNFDGQQSNPNRDN